MKEQYDNFFEKFLLAFAGPEWQSDLEQAKQEFYGSLGTEGDDMHGFESQSDLFFCWFLLTRPLEASKKTPLEMMVSGEAPVNLSDEESQYLAGLLKHEKSIYEVSKIKDQHVFLKDLFSGEKRKLICFDSLVGFEKGQYLSTWIWPLENQFYFVKGLCFHPDEPKKFIRKEISVFRKAKGKEKGPEFDDFFLAFIRMKLKADKYHHIRPRDIYTFSDKVKL